MSTFAVLGDDEETLKKMLWQLPLFAGEAGMRSEWLTAAGLRIVYDNLLPGLNRVDFFVSTVNALLRTWIPGPAGDRLAMIVLLEETVGSSDRLKGVVPDDVFTLFQSVIDRYDEARQSGALLPPNGAHGAADSLPLSVGTVGAPSRAGVGARMEALGEEGVFNFGENGAADERFVVDRHPERMTFRDMVQERIGEHVMLVRAEKGMGKTWLLDAFWEGSAALRRVWVTVYSGITVGSILHSMARQLDTEDFSEFLGRYDLFAQGPSVTIKDFAVRDVDAPFRIAAQEGRSDLELRNDRNHILTSLFFKGIVHLQRRISQPVVLLIDSFQDASDEIQEWLANVFLGEHVGAQRWLVVVVAGEKVPEPRRELRGWGVIRDLQGLGLQESREFFMLLNVELTDDQYQLLHTTSNGRPYDLKAYSDSILKRNVRSE